MDTRIIHTKIHFEDDWFNSMPFEYKYPFIYLFTNRHIRQTGIYQLTERVALLETGASPKQWQSAVSYFIESKKIGVYHDWICVVNAQRHTNYAGPKNEAAFQKELESIPQDVIKHFLDTLSIQYIYPIDTTINNKYKIINQKQETRNQSSNKLVKTLAEKIADDVDEGLNKQYV